MGRQAVPERLFYDFSFETHIPTDHLLRKVDAALDFSFVTVALKVHYSDIGRPSVDPERMIRMLMIGYLMAFAPSVGFARRSISILPIAGSANLGSKVKCPIHPRSRRTGTADSATAISFEQYLKRWCTAALRLGLSVARV
jgi:hypothetical protein